MLSSRVLSKENGVKVVVQLIIHLLDVSKGLKYTKKITRL